MRPLNDSPETDSSISALRKIRDRIWEVRTAYYPCSLDDVRLSAVFPETKIVRLDLAFPPNAVTPEGTTDIIADATTYSLNEDVDLVFISNPSIWHSYLVRFAKVGWYVISNDYHDTAARLAEREDFQLIGCQTIGEGWIESRIANESLKRVRTDAEWICTSPSSFERTLKIQHAVQEKYGAILGARHEGQSLVNWTDEALKRISDIRMGMRHSDAVFMGYDALAMRIGQDLQGLSLPPRRKPKMNDALFVFRRIR